MLVSICIPAYNTEKYIDANLSSIFNQTYQDFEVIIVDDGSSDNTAKKIKLWADKYPDKIFPFFSPKNQRIGATRNIALRHAHGEYIFHCDSDDYLKPDFLEALVSEAKRSGYPDIVIGGFTKIDQDGNVLYERKYSMKEEALQQSFTMWAKLYKRSFLFENNIWSPVDVVLEDVLFQARVMSRSPTVAVTNNCGYFYVTNLTSSSNTKLKGFQFESLETGFSYLREGYQDLNTAEEKRRMLYYIMLYVTWHLLKAGAGAGAKVVRDEYRQAKKFLDTYFPEYRHINYVSLTRPKGSRRIVRWAVLGTAILTKLSIGDPFFSLYGFLNLSKFWPNL